MVKCKKLIGFNWQNYVKSGDKHKGLGLFIIAGSLLILWIALMIGMNLYLKGLHATNAWVFLGPLDILRIVWKVSMYSSIELGYLKWDIVSYAIWPIAITVLLSTILFRVTDNITKSRARNGAFRSSIILDPKGENFDETSGYLQKKGHKCIRLDLGRPYHRYNPLAED